MREASGAVSTSSAPAACVEEDGGGEVMGVVRIGWVWVKWDETVGEVGASEGEGGRVGGGVRWREGCWIRDAKSKARVESSEPSAKNDTCSSAGRD